MIRIKSGLTKKNRHKKIIKKIKGRIPRLFKTCKQQILHAGNYSYNSRKEKKRNNRKLWIKRINIHEKKYKSKYNIKIKTLKRENSKINRKILSNIILKNKI